MKARAQGLPGLTRVTQQPAPAIKAPGSPLVFVHQCVAPSFLGTAPGIAAM